ncbi:MOLPALP family lipoprotein [Mycoplasma mycoides subsp. capri]|uniref:MOLPALP family lipoprotein n=1 Tax=Mycoplasma mycoides TaxID=2102 RepID=UPI0022402D19|nr:MOLPALP family lipoprotein [Mycoplasma mycoides]QVJ95972.1 MOLPALP family lipoprotein [Mycoplasma mycoides subsp. capri]QVJ96864.1 MOLPALP family lipoprotein [Mycoplasma mycoides subsp. capri]QVJ99906.1 MOLPALP family lipoprotein [Mycoplasma mycoides subsp. capri]QVK00728.1 MOLPALP family lipoprotein [Mycoplasma mycoides subsp. capri]
MKKLIAILSSVMMISTASLPVIACHKKEYKFETNNSLTNTKTAISLFAKNFILADQLQLNFQEIKNLNENKNLELLTNQNNLVLDKDELSLDSLKSTNQFINKYFDQNSYKNVLDKNIKLDSNKSLNNFVLDEVFKLLNLDISDTQKTSDDLIQILELTSKLNPSFMFNNFSNIDSSLKQIFEKLKPSLKTWLESLSNLDKNLIDNINNFKEKIDVNNKYKDLKLEDLDKAFYTSLINAIGLGLNPTTYKVVELDIKNTNNSLKQASQNLANIISNKKEVKQNKEWEIVAYILQAIQFLQLKLSLFDSTKNYQIKSADHLFSDTKSNQDFIKDVYSSKKISDITKNKPSSINLKYLLSFFKKPVGELKDPNNKNGYELQKLLAMLFLSENKVEYNTTSTINDPKDYYEKQQAHPSIYLLSVLLKDFLIKKLSPLLVNAKKENVENLVERSIPYFYKWLSYATTNLLTGSANIYETLSALFVKVLPSIVVIIQEETKLLSKEIITFKDLAFPVLFEQIIAPTLNEGFPITKKSRDKNSFKELYSGNIFLVDKTDEMFKTFKQKVEHLLKSFGSFIPIKSTDIPFSLIQHYFDSFKNQYQSIFKNVQQFNLKTLLTTPLNKMNESWWKDKTFAKEYQNKSIADNLDKLLQDLGIKGDEKLDDLSSLDINLTSLTDIILKIQKYDYKPSGVEYKNNSSLIDILKSNSDKVLQIIGWTSDKNNLIAKDSLLDIIFSKTLNINLNDKNNNSQNTINLLSKFLLSVNNSLNTEFNDKKFNITYTFLDDKKNKFNQLVSQQLEAKFINNKNITKYMFDYSRTNKNDKFRFTKITKTN